MLEKGEQILRPGAGTPLAGVHAPATKACILIGPEGGFADEEIEEAVAAGARPVTLGLRILRSETAAIVASALALSALGELRYPSGRPQCRYRCQ